VCSSDLISKWFYSIMTSPSSPSLSSHYVDEHLPPSVTQQLEAAAFRSLCAHLKERSDSVPNIDLMTVSGFCRNCLAKWMVLEARRLSVQLQTNSTALDVVDRNNHNNILQSLDAMGYDEAAQYVYGCNYADWKIAHSSKASKEQMERYELSKPLHALHDDAILMKRTNMTATSATTSSTSAPTTSATSAETTCPSQPPSSSLLSNVCCQDVDDVSVSAPTFGIAPSSTTTATLSTTRSTRTLPPFSPPPPPTGGVNFTCAILTISDRAFTNQYETGDLSGPAAEEAVMTASATIRVCCTIVDRTIVPDTTDAIQTKLMDYANQGIHLVLTTGGTGFSKRDVTPEATASIVDRPLPGLLSFITTECSRTQPLSSLSRGVAGIRDKTMIVNLPGNPKGVQEIVPLLLPIVVHGIKDIQAE